MSRNGFGLIELIVAIGLFLILATTGLAGVIGSLSSNRLGQEHSQAVFLAQEGIEAVSALKQADWQNNIVQANCQSGCGVEPNNSFWDWTGSSTQHNPFKRTIYVRPVSRDANNQVTENGGEIDPDSYLVESEVTWSFTPSRQNSVTFEKLLTNFTKSITTDWSEPTIAASLDLLGNQNGWKVAAFGQYAVVIRQNGNPDFSIIDVTNPASPQVTANLSLPGDPRNIAVEGDYAYIASTSNVSELQIIDLSLPQAPIISGLYDAPGNANMLGIHVESQIAYLTRDSNKESELYVVDVSNPLTPIELGSLELGADSNEVVVVDDYAYVASDDNAAEVQVIDVSNLQSPILESTADLVSNQNAETIASFEDLLIVGRSSNTGRIHLLDAQDPTSISEVAETSALDDVRDAVLLETFAFAASDENSSELQVYSISDQSNPTLTQAFDLSGNANGIAYLPEVEAVVVVTDADSEELIIITP